MNGLALCAGVGGLEIGVRLAWPWVRTVAYVERDAYAAAVLVARMEDEALEPAPIWDDLSTFDGRPWRGCVDLVTAGFSCQPWSAAGKGRGTDDERWIWPEVARVVREVEPRFVLLENVPPLVIRGGLALVLGDLADLGLNAEWGVFSAAEVGAPHLRRRLFILAYRKGQRRREARRVQCGGPEERTARRGEALDDSYGKGRGQDERAAQTRGPDAAQRGGSKLADPYVGSTGLDAQGIQARQPEPSGHGDRGDREVPVRLRVRDSVGHDGPGRRVPRLQQEGNNGPGNLPKLGNAGGPGLSRWPGQAGETEPFPPGPGGDWSGIPEDAQPSIRRGPDGIPSRVDRLRCCGNGVVPLVAAHALRTLAARALT